ncbi:MAG: hypothetical protein ACRDZW_02790 [Acidimicrobiales bacterium]
MLGQVGDRLERGIDQGFVKSGEAPKVAENLREQDAVERPSHSAIVVGLPTQSLGRLVELDPFGGAVESLPGSAASRWSSMAGRISIQSSQGMMTPWGRRWLPKVTGSAPAPERANSATIWDNFALASVVGRMSLCLVCATGRRYHNPYGFRYE